MQEPDFHAKEFLNLCQNGTNSSMCLGIMSKIVILQWNTRATFKNVIASHLITMTYGRLPTYLTPYIPQHVHTDVTFVAKSL